MAEGIQNIVERTNERVHQVTNAFSKRHSDPVGVAFFYFIGRKVYIIVCTINSLYIRIRDVFAKSHFRFEFEPSSFTSFTDDEPSSPTRLSLPAAPSWKTNFRARASKVKQLPSNTLNRPALHRISDRNFKAVMAEKKGAEPIETVKFGAGIPNGSNCCFMASVVQALRVSPSFRQRLLSSDLRHRPVVQELRKIYDIIEGRPNHPKRALTDQEVIHFRQTCIESGCKLDSRGSQEDPSHFCQFLMSEVGLKVIPVREFKDHSFQIPVNSLDNDVESNIDFDLLASNEKTVIQTNKPLPLTDNLVTLQIAGAKEVITELKQLVSERAQVVDVERKLVQKDLTEKKLLTPELEEKIKSLNDVELVDVKKTLQLFPKHIPNILPIYLERADYNPKTFECFINNRKIDPSPFLEFPLVDQPGVVARYEFISAVTRQAPITDEVQKSINKESGHYAAWTKYQHKNKAIFAEYNSGKALLHTDTADKALEGIKQNSRLFLYEFVGLFRAP